MKYDRNTMLLGDNGELGGAWMDTRKAARCTYIGIIVAYAMGQYLSEYNTYTPVVQGQKFYN